MAFVIIGDAVITRRGKRVAVLSAPALWDYEMANLWQTALRRGRMEEQDADRASTLLQAVPRRTYDHVTSLWQRRLMVIARRFHLSAYDAAYLELSDRLQGKLIRVDDRLCAAAREMGLSTTRYGS
jgi:predicted nucleic acid-binding protein